MNLREALDDLGGATIKGTFAASPGGKPTISEVTFPNVEQWKRFKISFTWASGGRGTTFSLGRDARHALNRFTASMPGISSACVVAESSFAPKIGLHPISGGEATNGMRGVS